MSSFLQSGKSTGDVFVISPHERTNRKVYWLIVASCIIVDANAKWQLHSDNSILDTALHSTVNISQLFCLSDETGLKLVVAKNVDDILVVGFDQYRKSSIGRLFSSYEAGTFVHLSGTFRLFGMNASQNDEYCIQALDDDELNLLERHSVTYLRPNR